MMLLRKLWRLSLFVLSLLGLGAVFTLLSFSKKRKMADLRLRVFSRWSRWILRLFGIRLHDNLFSRDEVPSHARVIISNHVSYLDIPIIASFGPTLFLAKKEVSEWPLMGRLGKSLGMLFVDRASLISRAKAIVDIKSQVRHGRNVVIFPEGTTSISGPVRGQVPYYAGAFRVARDQNVPVEVIYLDYKELDICAWVGEQTFGDHLWKFLGAPKITVKIRREWIPAIPGKPSQREAYHWSRQWINEGGHGFFSGVRKAVSLRPDLGW